MTPINDRSFWRLSKQGPFQGYQSKKFYLPVPSTKAVLERRVEYLKRRISDNRTRGQYLTTRGIRLSVENIEAFAACLEGTFLREDFVSRRISWLANNNIHRSLELTQTVIMSPFFSVDDLIKTYVASGVHSFSQPHYMKFMKALVLGNYNIYLDEKSEFIANVFEISPHSPTSPLMNLSVLKVLIDRAGDGSGAAAYLSVEHLRQIFETLGATEASVNHSITSMLSNGLIGTYDTSKETIETSERIAITHSGRMHYEMACSDPIYFTQMAFATPMRDLDLVEMFRSLNERAMAADAWHAVEEAFAGYLLEQDREYFRLPRDEMFDGQRHLRNSFEARWIGRRGGVQEQRPPAQRATPDSMGYSHIPVVMKWYNVVKGYGFGEAGLAEDVFVHYALLNQAGIQDLFTGDTLVADVAVTQQGRLQAIAIHSFERGSAAGNAETSSRVVEGRVQFYNPKKAFGFIKSGVFDEDIYFSAKALERGGLRDVQTGATVWARVEPSRFGRGLAASVVAAAPLVEAAQ